MPEQIFDVAIVGYGPVAQLFALALGRQGRSVAVIERWQNRYPLPRAVCIDHELYRVLSANGMGPLLPEISHEGAIYRWFNAEWKELLAIDWTRESVSGGSEVNFVHQPTLEEAMDAMVVRQPSVTLLLGQEAVAVGQEAGHGWIDIQDVETGAPRRIKASYVVGCDGANSLVRETIGGGREDRGFEADWLVIDVLLKEGVTIESLGIPASGQYCNPAQPTTIVPAGVRDGRRFRRWEFMRLPGVPVEEMEREERVWELLSPWAGPDQVELVRHKVYNFRSLIARRWRDRRLLIAGDAAHVMPPFMGQGMCSGMRDVWNLAWRLALILDGKADDRLLDGYQAERLPHLSQLVDMSVFLGKIICIPDPAEAAERDRAFFAGDIPPFPDFPILSDGLLLHGADGAPVRGAGELAPHAVVAWDGREGRLDDLLGPGFMLVTREAVAVPPALAALPLHIVPLGDAGAVDRDGKFAPYLAERGWASMIVRPDYYVYGGAAAGEAAALLDRFAVDCAANGIASVAPAAAARLRA